MKKLRSTRIALAVAAALFASGCADVNNLPTPAGNQGRPARTRGTTADLPAPGPESTHPEADYDFGEADAYRNEHPSGGGPN